MIFLVKINESPIEEEKRYLRDVDFTGFFVMKYDFWT